MNILNNIDIICLLAGLLTLASCAKTESSPVLPEIAFNVVAPQPGANYANGDTVQISAAVNSPVDLHGYTWQVVNKSSQEVLASADEHAHGRSLAIHGAWVNNVSESTSATVVLTVEIDHEGHTASKTIDISLNP